MLNKSIILSILALYTSLAFADLEVSPKKGNAWTQNIASLASDYGIPLVAETGLEAVNWLTRLDPTSKLSICEAGLPPFLCWYFLSAVALQKNNIQSGLSRHLQEKVTSKTQYYYNRLFASAESKRASQEAQKMERLRAATMWAQSLESYKARAAVTQIRPVLNSLFGLAFEQFKGQPISDPTRNAARLVGYGAILIASYFPDYNGSQDEIGANARSLYALLKKEDERVAGDPTFFRSLVREEAIALLGNTALGENALVARIDEIICEWSTHQQTQHLPVTLKKPEHSNSGTSHMTTLAGLLAPSMMFNVFPNSKGLSSQALRPSLNSIAQNTADAATRIVVNDLAAHIRRTVQKIGSPEKSVSRAENYEELRAHQLYVANTWSEIGIKMRANVFRYLGILVPAFAEASKQLAKGNTKAAAAVLASQVSYIRQYDPEYKTDDITMKMAARAVFGDLTFLVSEGFCDFDSQDFLGEFYLQLALFDPGFRDSPVVGQYYREVITSFHAGTKAQADAQTASLSFPMGSVGLSLLVENLSAAIKIGLSYLPKGYKEFASVEYARTADAVIRATGDPAKDDIQQYLADKLSSSERTSTEDQLVSVCAEMVGRTGMDAQMARAINERLQPTLFNFFDAARESYEDGDRASAARLIAYSTIFLAYIYPEAPSSDEMIADFARARFSQFIDPNDPEFAQLTAKSLFHFMGSADPVLACQLDARLRSFDLSTAAEIFGLCQDNKKASQSFASWSWEIGKSAAYYGGMSVVLLSPYLSTTKYAPSNYQIVKNYRLASLFVSAAQNLAVNSVFLGILKPQLDWAKSQAQIWSQYFWITPRVDEKENSGRSQNYFAKRQWELPQFLSPNAQEGRKDLLAIAQNIATDFRIAKNAFLRGDNDVAISQLEALDRFLVSHFSDATGYYKPMMADIHYAFFGDSVDSGPEQVVSPCDDEGTCEAL